MAEHQIDLQAAIGLATSMVKERVEDYGRLRNDIPSFGELYDIQLNKYLDALGSTLQGFARWYYDVPRELLNHIVGPVVYLCLFRIQPWIKLLEERRDNSSCTPS